MVVMTSVASTPTTKSEAPRPRRRRRWLWIGLPVLLIVLAVLAFGLWLALGLKSAARDVKAHATDTQNALQAFKTALTAGDQQAADQQLASARTSLAAASVAADRQQVRIAGHLPMGSTAVHDLDHLLTAAGLVVAAGDKVSGIYGDFSGADSTLFRDNQVDLPSLNNAIEATGTIDGQMARAEKELTAVKGTVPGTSSVLDARDSALKQVKDLRKQIADLRPILQVVPDAVGATQPKRYMVALMNPAEMHASGGIPLNVVVLQFTKGKMTTVQQGSTAQLTARDGQENAPAFWPRTRGNPYRGIQRFANANQNPDFPVSGEEMRRGWKSSTGKGINGVIALDVTALQDLMTVTGPIKTEGYGTITPDNLVQKLLVDAYTDFSADQNDRRELNNQVVSTMLSQLTSGGQLIGKGKALAKAVPARHLMTYFQDPKVQQLVVDKKLAGALSTPSTGDYLAAYTQNENGSKLDVFQQRTLEISADVRADGSASVTQTMTLKNNVSAKGFRPALDPKIGYSTRYAGEQVIFYLPPHATGVKVSGDGDVTKALEDTDGRQIQQRRGLLLAPGQTGVVRMTYRLPAGTFGSAKRLNYSLVAEPSNLLNTPALVVHVAVPEGWTPTAAPGWTIAGRTASQQVPMDQLRTLTLAATR